MERGWRDITPNCPRCGSSNTKFCYYNNYSLTQPRYFCKGCRRYWTKGGSLRNVPVGGGCRKSRRSRSSATLRQLAGVSSNLTNNHHGVTYRSHSSPIFGTNNNNDHVNNNNNSYGIIDGDLSNVVESSTPSIHSEAPTIDLAAVYANFLTQKSSTKPLPDQVLHSSHEFNNPPHVDFSSIPDATSIVPSTQQQIVLQQQHTTVNIMENNNNHPTLNFSQTCLSVPPPLSISNDNQNPFFASADFRTSVHHHHEDTSTIMQHDQLVELPPLPGESSSSHDHQEMQWRITSTSNNNNNHINGDDQIHHQHGHTNMGATRDSSDLEQDAQFSNIFVGSWSPLDLPGFETSSSPSKP